MGTATATIPGLFALDVQARNGTPFRVLVIPPGVAGPNAARTPADRSYPMVEFWDLRFKANHPDHGQFTGGYYDLGTLMEPGGYGLNLAGGVDAWQVDGETMDLIRTWLAQLDARGALVGR